MRRRRIAGPRRVPILALVGGELVYDDAIDIKATDVTAYYESLFDPALLKFHPGESPSWFSIQPMTGAHKRAIPGASQLVDHSWRVRCSLTAIDGYALIDDTGAERPAPQPDRSGHDGVSTQDWLDSTHLSIVEIVALGIMAVHLSEAQAPLSRRSSKPSGHSTSSDPPMET